MADNEEFPEEIPDVEECRENMIEITIDSIPGEPFTLNVSSDISIRSVKFKIENLKGIPHWQQHLIYKFKELENSASLISCNIEDGSVIKLFSSMQAYSCSTQEPVFYEPLTDEEFKVIRSTCFILLTYSLLMNGDIQTEVLKFRTGNIVKKFHFLVNEDSSLSPLRCDEFFDYLKSGNITKDKKNCKFKYLVVQMEEVQYFIYVQENEDGTFTPRCVCPKLGGLEDLSDDDVCEQYEKKMQEDIKMKKTVLYLKAQMKEAKARKKLSKLNNPGGLREDPQDVIDKTKKVCEQHFEFQPSSHDHEPKPFNFSARTSVENSCITDSNVKCMSEFSSHMCEKLKTVHSDVTATTKEFANKEDSREKLAAEGGHQPLVENKNPVKETSKFEMYSTDDLENMFLNSQAWDFTLNGVGPPASASTYYDEMDCDFHSHDNKKNKIYSCFQCARKLKKGKRYMCLCRKQFCASHQQPERHDCRYSKNQDFHNRK